MRVLLACLLGLLLCSTVAAVEYVNVTAAEVGRITDYFGQYWVVNVDGNLSITNPTNRDLYSISLRYNIQPLSLIEQGGTTYFQNGALNIPRLPANSTLRIPYNIVGISIEDPTLLNKGVLYTGLAQFDPVIYSDTFGALQKASMEDSAYTGRDARLVSVELRNPSGFQYTVQSIRVIKTPALDPNVMLEDWKLVNSSQPVLLNPDAIFVRDILDRDATEGEVYWLAADVFISQVQFNDASNITRYTEVNLTLPPELLNYTINETNGTNRTLPSVSELYGKKISSQQLVTVGEPITVTIIVNNFATRLFNFTITDTLPPGFVFRGGEGWTEKNGKLIYTGDISAKNAHVATYSAELTDNEAAGLDFFERATIEYIVDKAAKAVYTDNVPFIRQFMPDSELYVQKKLRYEDEDQVLVTITIQNLGAGPVQNLLIKEYLEDSDVFSQISEIPEEKGMWGVKEIKSGESWEVTYITTTDTKLNILPGVYGVASTGVLKSLVLENVIATAWEVVRTAALEVIGILLLIGLPVLYFFMKKKHTLDLPKQ